MGERGEQARYRRYFRTRTKEWNFGTKDRGFQDIRITEGRKDKLAVTELGKRAVSGDETERNEAIGDAVKHIKLWSIFYRKYGTSIPRENFAVTLRRETGAEPSVAEKNANFIRNAYLKDVALIESVGEPKTEAENEEPLGQGLADRKPDMEEQAAGNKKSQHGNWVEITV